MQCVALIEHPLGSGSGFAVGKKLVVTNAHVVEGVFADEIKVRLRHGKQQTADRHADLVFRPLAGSVPSSSCRPS